MDVSYSLKIVPDFFFPIQSHLLFYGDILFCAFIAAKSFKIISRSKFQLLLHT